VDRIPDVQRDLRDRDPFAPSSPVEREMRHVVRAIQIRAVPATREFDRSADIPVTASLGPVGSGAYAAMPRRPVRDHPQVLREGVHVLCACGPIVDVRNGGFHDATVRANERRDPVAGGVARRTTRRVSRQHRPQGGAGIGRGVTEELMSVCRHPPGAHDGIHLAEM